MSTHYFQILVDLNADFIIWRDDLKPELDAQMFFARCNVGYIVAFPIAAVLSINFLQVLLPIAKVSLLLLFFCIFCGYIVALPIAGVYFPDILLLSHHATLSRCTPLGGKEIKRLTLEIKLFIAFDRKALMVLMKAIMNFAYIVVVA